MQEVVITGVGVVSSIGSSAQSVTDNLKNLRHGVVRYAPFEDPKIPVHVAAPVQGNFNTESTDPEDWTFPGKYTLKRDVLRSLPPHGLYAHCALTDALEDAGLSLEDIGTPETGLYTASVGSPGLQHHHMHRMFEKGVQRCSPLSIVASICGTLNFNLVAAFKIQGASGGFVSACASSGHALGFARDEIALGRQQRMLVVGAEDGNLGSILPFASMRALSPSECPDSASRPFDAKRNGFVGTGGAAALVLESAEAAAARGAAPIANFAGWGQASDGHNVAISHPEGRGLQEAMRRALKASGLSPEAMQYINAHAPSTPIGDLSELKALQAVFGAVSTGSTGPGISSTKALTGHGLSLASALEAALCLLAMRSGFTPGSANITQLDAAAENLNILRETLPTAPSTVMSNSSGFGGANVSLVFKKA